MTLPKNQGPGAELLRGSLKQDGTVDLRSAYGQALKAMREALREDLHNTARDMLEKQVASLSLLEQAIMSHILSDPDSFLIEGQLNRMISVDLLKFQSAQRAALGQLAALREKEKMKSAKGAGRDLSAISFD